MKRDRLPKVACWLAVGAFVWSIASCSSTHSQGTVDNGGAGAPPGDGGTFGLAGNAGEAGAPPGNGGTFGLAGDGNEGGSGNTDVGGGSSGDACVLTTDCDDIDDSYICIFQVCSPVCAGDRDCDEGQRCLLTEDGAACVEPDMVGCRDDGECPAGSICLDDVCRTDCSDEADLCLDDQECSQFGVCRGTDAEHDPPEETSSGTPCDSEGEVDCAGVASIARLVCEGGYWLTHDACEEGELCVPTGDDRGSCQEIPADCIGREPNESFCDSATRKTCSVSLLEVESEDCPSIQHCTLGQGSSCAECLPNTFECDDDILKTCKDDGSGYTETDCALLGEPCSATAGTCTEDVCSDDQLRCGDGDVLERCNDLRDDFDPAGYCGAGLCDSQALECDVCISGATSCVDGQKVECSADGQTESVGDCDSRTPYCIGAGNCVQCIEASHCPEVEECSTRTCDNNTCTPIPVDVNTPCTGGFCDGAGNCVECTSPGQCTDTECTNATCVGNTCGSQNEVPGTDCSAGECNSSGTCVGCISAGSCSVSGDCYNPTCSGGNCGQTPKGSGQTCSGGYCNGSGACVQCTSPDHCSASGECFDPTCSGGGCGETPKNSGIPCSGGYCNGNGSCVECTSPDHCSGGTPACFNGSCVQCSPGGADICASSCTRQVRSCTPTGEWQNDTVCTGDAYCSSGSCVTDSVIHGWDDASGTTLEVVSINAQKIQLNCRSLIQSLGAHFTAPGGGNVVMAIYSHDNGADGPGVFLAGTTAGLVPADGNWKRDVITPVVLAGGTYWIAVQAASNAPDMFHTSSGNGRRMQGTFDLAMPTVYSNYTVQDGTYHMYAVMRPAP